MAYRASFCILPFLLAASQAVRADAPAATAPATTMASPVYTELLSIYMSGRFDVLETRLKEKPAALVGLSTPEQADIAAMRLALREGRPDWWNRTKTGAKGQIMPALWGRKIPVQFDPQASYGADITMKGELMALSAGWANADMDSTAPSGSPGFTKGDVVCLTAFSNLGNVDSWSQIPRGGSQIPKDRYLEFRGKLTGMAYGTPTARRYGMYICLASFKDENPKSPIRMARRAIGTMFLGELLAHPETFPSIPLPKTAPAENTEEALCLGLADHVAKNPWTFAEDGALRIAIKQFAVANGTKTYTTGLVTLPNKLTVALDPKEDAAPMAAREAWIKKMFAAK